MRHAPALPLARALLGAALLGAALLAVPLCGIVTDRVGVGCLLLTVALVAAAVAALWSEPPGRGLGPCPGCGVVQAPNPDVLQGALVARCMACGHTVPL